MSFPVPVKYESGKVIYSDGAEQTFPPGGDSAGGGSGGTGGFIVQMDVTDTPMVTDKTFGEIYEAFNNSIPIFVHITFSGDEYMSPIVNVKAVFDDEELISISFIIVNYKEYVDLFKFVPYGAGNTFSCTEWRLAE